MSNPIKQDTALESYNNNKGEAVLAKIVGRSHQIKQVKELIRRISQFPEAPVLITGETGTGKELVADALHACSPRKDGPLIKVNCAAIPENLFESQLFGHRKGAFSGAATDHKGLVQEASNGTLFLDEISSLRVEHQAKILRFLEDGSYFRISETVQRKSNAWILAATNQDLEHLAEQGLVRPDLCYRLKSEEIELPPLRQRGQDVLALSKHFLKNYSRKLVEQPKRLSAEAQELLMYYDWPGNVRELRNAMRALTTRVPTSLIMATHLSQLPSNRKRQPTTEDVKPLREVERKHIIETIMKTGCRVRETARLLEIDRNTLKRKLIAYGIYESILDRGG